MTTRERLISADDFWELSQSANDELRRDLIEGVVHEMSPAGEAHGVIALKLGARILEFVETHKLGRVTAAETGYILHRNPDGKDTVLAPAVAFTRKERMPAQPNPKFAPIAPDLAVEVVSPNDSYPEVAHKIRLYLAYGTRLVWIVDPKGRTVEVHTPSGMQLLQGDDMLDGFTLSLRDVFPIEV